MPSPLSNSLTQQQVSACLYIYVYRCSEDSTHCVTVVQYTPNLQDDSDANFDDQAGRMIRIERGCDQVGL